jgi:hypothetical protein
MPDRYDEMAQQALVRALVADPIPNMEPGHVSADPHERRVREVARALRAAVAAERERVREAHALLRDASEVMEDATDCIDGIDYLFCNEIKAAGGDMSGGPAHVRSCLDDMREEILALDLGSKK